jgi:hypothetical protein
MANLPAVLFHPDSDDPDKVLRAHNQAELDGLLRIGWKVVEIDPQSRWTTWRAKEAARLKKLAEAKAN